MTKSVPLNNSSNIPRTPAKKMMLMSYAPANTIRGNNTGSIAPVSDLTAAQVGAMVTLDQLAVPSANVSMNSHKITSLTNGSAATDAATYGQVGRVIASGTGAPLTTVVNTVTQTTFVTAAMEAGQTGDLYRLHAWGDMLNNSGTSQTYTINVTLGSTSLGNTSANTQATNASRGTWVIDLDLYMSALTTAQATTFAMRIQNVGPATQYGTSTLYSGSKVSAVDLTAATNLVLKVTMNLADANMDWRTLGYVLTRVR